jgi:hypothetical protein
MFVRSASLFSIFILGVFMAAASTSATVQPVTSWDFEDAAGEQLTDNSSNGNRGTIHGATWVAIDGGHALRY